MCRRRSARSNAEGIEYLEREFKRMGLAATVPSHANFVLTEVGDGQVVFDRLLKLGVIVRPMGSYGWPRHVQDHREACQPENRQAGRAALEENRTKPEEQRGVSRRTSPQSALQRLEGPERRGRRTRRKSL